MLLPARNEESALVYPNERRMKQSLEASVPLVFHPIYSQLDLPPRHRFPIEKYQGIKDALLAFGVSEQQFHVPQAIELDFCKRYLCHRYIDALCRGQLSEKEMKRIGFPWSSQLIRRTLTAVGGTVLASNLALEYGLALNLTGGYHHAFADFGSGFCMLNDLYLSAQSMLNHAYVDKILIFDCDVHQGDGTAKLAENNANIFTVSLHGEKNFPHRKQVSDMDFALAKGTRDKLYLETVEQAFELAIKIANPDAIIYDAGVDIHIDDDLGHLNISTEGILARDKYIVSRCTQMGLPLVCVIGGGYQRNINALVEVHLQLFRAAGVF